MLSISLKALYCITQEGLYKALRRTLPDILCRLACKNKGSGQQQYYKVRHGAAWLLGGTVDGGNELVLGCLHILHPQAATLAPDQQPPPTYTVGPISFY